MSERAGVLTGAPTLSFVHRVLTRSLSFSHPREVGSAFRSGFFTRRGVESAPRSFRDRFFFPFLPAPLLAALRSKLFARPYRLWVPPVRPMWLSGDCTRWIWRFIATEGEVGCSVDAGLAMLG